MKKAMLALAITGCAIIGSMTSANAYDGVIKFTGSLTADACKIDAGSQNLPVDLGQVATTAFNAGKGTKASPTKFSLQLTDCPATVKGATVKFDGTSDTADTTLVALDSGSDATGVGVEISDNTGAAIPLHSASPVYTLAPGDNTLDFVARYVSDNATVAAGEADATSQFTLNYQ